MSMVVFAVCEQIRLATGAVSRIDGLCDLVRRAMVSAGLRGIGLSGGFFMTTLGSGVGGFGMSTLGGDAKGLTFR